MSEVRELRQMREENARLKRLVADLTLDKQILQEVTRKRLKPARRRGLAQWIDDRPASAQELIEGWRRDYNDHRPHGALGHLTPSEYAEQGQTHGSEAAA